VASSPSGGTETQPASTLPFTGLDLSLIVAVGLLLVGTGYGMRRLSRSPQQ
jgi:hypothetical protein